MQKWGLKSYLGVDLKWRMFRGDISREAVSQAMSAGDDENDESADTGGGELPNELQFEHGITRRSRGTVQHDWFEWTQHRAEFSTNHYTLAIDAFKRWQRNQMPVPYAFVVRIEDLGGTVLVYNDVLSLLAPIETTIRI